MPRPQTPPTAPSPSREFPDRHFRVYAADCSGLHRLPGSPVPLRPTAPAAPDPTALRPE